MSPTTPANLDNLPAARGRACATVNLDALVKNARTCATIAGPDSQLLAVIKADAYGHGIVETATALAPLPELWGYGVANLTEAATIAAAIDLVAAGKKVLILGPVLPGERAAVAAGGFSVEVSSVEEVAAWQDIGGEIRVHATVDTGMGRMGALPDDFPALVESIRQSPQLTLEGVATHFPSADEDAEFTRSQIAEFECLLEKLELPADTLIHASNSAGVLAFSDRMQRTNLIRPGLALYGASPVPDHADELRPVLELTSAVTLVRDLPAGHGISYGRTFITDRPTVVATVGVGYGDGYPRSLSGNGADVLIAGMRCPLLGRVTMDQIMVDVTGLPQRPQPGDEVTLIGGEITAAEIAQKAGTIPWEIFTGITKRVLRVYRCSSARAALAP